MRRRTPAKSSLWQAFNPSSEGGIDAQKMGAVTKDCPLTDKRFRGLLEKRAL
jgi:hypothetical protein